MARVASQRFFHGKWHIEFVWPAFVFFYICSNQKRHALKFCEDMSNFQPVNSDLRPFRAFRWCPYQNNPRLSWSLYTERDINVWRYRYTNIQKHMYIYTYIHIYIYIYTHACTHTCVAQSHLHFTVRGIIGEGGLGKGRVRTERKLIRMEPYENS